MTRKRSSQHLFDSDNNSLKDDVDDGLNIDNLNNENVEEAEFSEGDDFSRFNKRVQSFDSKLNVSSKAVKKEKLIDSGIGGTIKDIELFSFMCHDHLKVELRDNINFIVGNNGSGKSAILTALTVCLGARASSTQRASTLESLIKEGSTEGRVIVRISNRGDLSYKHNLYGDSILIERRFKRNGPNTFKIKSGDSGRIISDRKDEVIAICDNYNIQVDNPLSVLTQETAKKFLVNSTPRDLYDFFMRATQLEQLSFDYAYALDRMKSIQNSLNLAKRSWPALEEKIDNLKIELTAISEQKETSLKIRELRAEILWKKIQELEEEAQKKDALILSEVERRKSNLETVSSLSRKFEECSETIKSHDTDITTLHNTKIPIHRDISSAKNNLAKVQADVKSSQNVLEEINSSVLKTKNLLAQIEIKIEECSKDSDKSKLEKIARIEKLEADIAENNRLQDYIKDEIYRKNAQIDLASGNLEKAEKIRNNLTDTQKTLKDSLEKLNSDGNNKLVYFGDNLSEALKEIESRKSEFKHKPVGPIGMYVELLDLSWSKPMDAIIGSQLASFITHDHKDRVLLESILRRHSCNNAVINISKEPIDTRNGEPDPRFLTALRALKIDNEAVKKALIMFASIERILLIADRSGATEVMLSRHRNVDACFTMHHKITATQNSLAFFGIYPSKKGNPFESREDRVRSFSKQLDDINHQLRILDRDIVRFRQSIDNLNAEKTNLNAQKQDLENSNANNFAELKEIERNSGNVEDGIDVWYSEKEKNVNSLDILKTQFGDNFDSQMRSSEEAARLEGLIKSLETQSSNIDKEIDHKKDTIIKLNDERKNIQKKLSSIDADNARISKNVETYKKGLEELNAEIVEKTRAALEVCERISSEKSVISIEKEIFRLEKLLEMGQEFNPEDYDGVKTEYDDLLEEYEKSKVNVRTNQHILDDMKIALEKRQRQWEDLRSGIAKRSNQDFASCLQARDYRGYLEYDHQNRELNINVHIDNIEQSQKSSKKELSKRDIKQLSGGEKSFGTTCFLLSLWDAMGCPIRCLDEFDVYMDAVNRRLVVEMLINNAINSGTQFILITPVSVRNFLDSDYHNSVHMVVLGDPQRI